MKYPKNNLSTVLESRNIILFDFICLGITLGTILQPMNIKKAKKIAKSHKFMYIFQSQTHEYGLP